MDLWHTYNEMGDALHHLYQGLSHMTHALEGVEETDHFAEVDALQTAIDELGQKISDTKDKYYREMMGV